MADSTDEAAAPRIARLTLWAIALDVAAVASVVVSYYLLFEVDENTASDAVLIVTIFAAPAAAIIALAISIRSGLSAGKRSAKIAAWITVLISLLLVLLSVGFIVVLSGSGS